MKSKIFIFFVIISVAGISAIFIFFSAGDLSSEQGRSNVHLPSVGMQSIDQYEEISSDLDLPQSGIETSKEFYGEGLSDEEMAAKSREFIRDLVDDMRRRSDGGVTVHTREESALVSEWRKRTGHGTREDTLTSDYDDYGLETLVSMGRQGDLKALKKVIVKARLQPRSPLASNILFFQREAVAAGSIPELYRLGEVHFNRAQEARDLGDEETFRKELVEGIAYANTRITRGEGAGIMTISKMMEKYDIQDDDELLKKAEQRGHQLYVEFVDLRRERGWGDFDNSVPDAVKRIQAYSICKNDESCVKEMLNQ